MGIRWLRNVVIDGHNSAIEIQIGDKRIGDKCYTRVGEEVEAWFDNYYENRDDIISQGLSILKSRLAGKTITYPNGQSYDWQ